MTHQSQPLSAEGFPTTCCSGRVKGRQNSECQGVCCSAIRWSKSLLSHCLSLTIILDVPIEPMLRPSHCTGLWGNRDKSDTALAFKLRDATEKEGDRDKVGGSYSNAKGQLKWQEGWALKDTLGKGSWGPCPLK